MTSYANSGGISSSITYTVGDAWTESVIRWERDLIARKGKKYTTQIECLNIADYETLFNTVSETLISQGVYCETLSSEGSEKSMMKCIGDDFVVEINSANKLATLRCDNGHRHELFEKWRSMYHRPSSFRYGSWFYLNSRGQIESSVMKIRNDPIKLTDEMYPFINGGIDSFIKGYLASQSMVLVMIGAPGTGKSSLIRYMINKYFNNHEACVAYDPQLVNSDDFYRYFLDEFKIAILEDADVTIESRDRGNMHMHRLLNVSEGIFDTSHHKLVITTNISDISHIDKALIRPGRCYDVVDFRHMTTSEANVVRGQLKLDDLADNGRTGYPLSEVFGNNKPALMPQRIGMVA